MFCSNCGKALGAVAHIYNDQLLCEDCFLKATGKSQRVNSPSTTVLLGKHDDEERANASQEISPELGVQVSPTLFSSRAAKGQFTRPSLLPQHASLLYSNEEVLWKRTLSKGVIHRHETFTEFITNLRAFVVVDPLGSIVRACLFQTASS